MFAELHVERWDDTRKFNSFRDCMRVILLLVQSQFTSQIHIIICISLTMRIVNTLFASQLKYFCILKHHCAVDNIVLHFFVCRPTQEMVKHVISRQFGDVDRFATSLLRHWALVHMEKLTEHLTALLINSKSRNTPPRKGLRQR